MKISCGRKQQRQQRKRGKIIGHRWQNKRVDNSGVEKG